MFWEHHYGSCSCCPFDDVHLLRSPSGGWPEKVQGLGRGRCSLSGGQAHAQSCYRRFHGLRVGLGVVGTANSSSLSTGLRGSLPSRPLGSGRDRRYSYARGRGSSKHGSYRRKQPVCALGEDPCQDEHSAPTRVCRGGTSAWSGQSFHLPLRRFYRRKQPPARSMARYRRNTLRDPHSRRDTDSTRIDASRAWTARSRGTANHTTSDKLAVAIDG